MKRCAIALAVILSLLCGCSEEPPQTTPPATTAQPSTENQPGLYLPGSDLEIATGGAVRVYGVGNSGSSQILRRWGSDILWIEAGEHAVFSRLSGENGVLRYQNTIDGVQIEGIWFLENEIAFYDQSSRSVIYLDGMLKEIKRIELPLEAAAYPALSKDLKTIYYSVGAQIRGLDTQTGISRLIRQGESPARMQMVFDESLLLCRGTEETDLLTQFVSTQSGETVATLHEPLKLATWQDRYFASYQESICKEWLFGVKGEAVQTLKLPEQPRSCEPLQNIYSAVTVTEGQEGVTLNLYDLEKGSRTASVHLPGFSAANAFEADADCNVIWFQAFDAQQQKNMLCRWEYEKSPVEDLTDYTEPRHTRDNPDTEGLAACTQRAKEISQKYGVTLVLDDQLPRPEGYTFVYEYQAPALTYALDVMERVLPIFPEEFLPALENGGLRIGLVRSVDGLTEDAVPDTDGLQYFVDGEGCVALAITENLEQAFYHQLYHVLDTYVYANSVLLDDWDTLNPKKFAYDGNYKDYSQRTDGKYLDGDDRAFVEEFSKTFSTEDRATLFVAAMTEGNEDMFASDTMQKKLQKLCSGIREAYEWKKDERSFLWEQYLKLPFAFQFKY